jgi:hypothetical protein
MMDRTTLKRKARAVMMLSAGGVKYDAVTYKVI